jgi:hypothetical protein
VKAKEREDSWAPWGTVLRDVAGYDPTKYEVIARMDLREVLLSFEGRLRERILVQHRHDQILFIHGGSKNKKEPTLPIWIQRQERDTDDN